MATFFLIIAILFILMGLGAAILYYDLASAILAFVAAALFLYIRSRRNKKQAPIFNTSKTYDAPLNKQGVNEIKNTRSTAPMRKPSNPVQTRASYTKQGATTCSKVELVDAQQAKDICKRFIAFDVETTGLSPEMDRIVEIGAVLFENGTVTGTFSTLVNPHMPIPKSATDINHITNAMLAEAPSEETVYWEFIQFLGDAANGKTVMCAHNAKFDFDFLCNTLSRLGYNAYFQYLDTLGLSRRFIKGLENYKLGTLERHFSLDNKAAHRASADAEICGEVLVRILSEVEDVLAEEKAQFEKAKPSPDEMEVCAFIQKMMVDAGRDISWLGFRKNSSGYVDVSCLYPFFKFKYTKKGKYAVLDETASKFAGQLPSEACTVSEGGTDNVRVYFASPFDLERFKSIIVKEFDENHKSAKEYLEFSSTGRRELQNWLNSIVRLSGDQVDEILVAVGEKEYPPLDSIVVTPTITREMVKVNAVHNRCPLSEIKNLGDWDKGFEAGFKYYEKAEEERKQGNYDKAIALYDKARYNGYEAPALYDRYAMTYHKMKDYDNEIVIIEEFLGRETYGKSGKFEAKRDAAIKALYEKQEVERKATEKAAEKAAEKVRKEQEKEEARKTKEPVQQGRAILQMDDAGNIIKEFPSLSQASTEIGVSTKSIRDAATGKQKHAGGYCWKYKNEEQII